MKWIALSLFSSALALTGCKPGSSSDKKETNAKNPQAVDASEQLRKSGHPFFACKGEENHPKYSTLQIKLYIDIWGPPPNNYFLAFIGDADENIRTYRIVGEIEREGSGLVGNYRAGGETLRIAFNGQGTAGSAKITESTGHEVVMTCHRDSDQLVIPSREVDARISKKLAGRSWCQPGSNPVRPRLHFHSDGRLEAEKLSHTIDSTGFQRTTVVGTLWGRWSLKKRVLTLDLDGTVIRYTKFDLNSEAGKEENLSLWAWNESGDRDIYKTCD